MVRSTLLQGVNIGKTGFPRINIILRLEVQIWKCKSPQINIPTDMFLRNTKSFHSRNYQLSGCPGWLFSAGLVSQSGPQKLKNMKNSESHENVILYYIFKDLCSIVPTRHINNAFYFLLSYMWCEALSFRGRYRKNRVPAHKHTLGPCNLNLNIEIFTNQNFGG